MDVKNMSHQVIIGLRFFSSRSIYGFIVNDCVAIPNSKIKLTKSSVMKVKVVTNDRTTATTPHLRCKRKTGIKIYIAIYKFSASEEHKRNT